MSFMSITFLIFFLILLAVMALVGRISGKRGAGAANWVLLAANYIFYGWWDWRFCFLMAAMTAIAWFSARLMEGKYRKIAITAAVAVPLVILGIFKYTNFFLGSLGALLGVEDLGTLKLLLPVGISFYTFQSMSYSIDVYRGKLKPTGPMEVALYVSFFPLVLSGPITKAQDFLPQLENRKITLRDLEAGGQLFLVGLFRKIVLADRLSVFVADIFTTPLAFSSFSVILGVIAYALQIYLDFAGYSDMAIGVARCLGFRLKDNFNLPYLSKNPTEFWKRWHISLSSWLQEYLYISLGGNRKGKIRTYVNLMLTMVLGGLWHGASWTFVVWGALHGLGLIIHKLWKASGRKMPALLGTLLNNIFVWLVWIFFRAESFPLAMQVLRKVFVWTPGITQIYSWLIFAVIMEIGYLLWCRIGQPKNPRGLQARPVILDMNTFWGLVWVFFGIMMTIGLAYTGGSPFIYFQF